MFEKVLNTPRSEGRQKVHWEQMCSMMGKMLEKIFNSSERGLIVRY